MTWLQRQRLHRFLRTTISLVPIACMLAALLLAPVLRWIDDRTRWALLDFGADGARNVLGALSSSLLTFIVFAFSTLLLVVQIASAQLTPRVIARVFEQRITKLTVGAFVFAWLYSLAAIGRIEDRVPQLPVAFAIAASLASIVLFLRLVQVCSRVLRPISVMSEVADDTCAVIAGLHPEAFAPHGEDHRMLPDPARATGTVRHAGAPGVVLAIDLQGLASVAARSGCTLEVVPMVGDFVCSDDPLFRVHGGSLPPADEARLAEGVDFGRERTIDQDPAFGLRVIVDIASKALSPAINDPTTATLAIDQIQRLLSLLARRRLDAAVVHDPGGRLRLFVRTPDWDDYVTMAVSEIRLYGATSPQVTRRLQAMLEALAAVVPERRRPALLSQLALLRGTVEGAYEDPTDRTQALRADLQGYGHPVQERGDGGPSREDGAAWIRP